MELKINATKYLAKAQSFKVIQVVYKNYRKAEHLSYYTKASFTLSDCHHKSDVVNNWVLFISMRLLSEEKHQIKMLRSSLQLFSVNGPLHNSSPRQG